MIYLSSNPNFDGFESSRLNVVDISNFGFDAGSFWFVPMLLGGLFFRLVIDKYRNHCDHDSIIK